MYKEYSFTEAKNKDSGFGFSFYKYPFVYSFFFLLPSLISLKGVPKKKTQTLSVYASELAVTGEGEDYFLSLFGDSKKLTTHSFHTDRRWKHFSVILEEVGHCRSRYIF